MFVSYRVSESEYHVAIVTALHDDDTVSLRTISPDGRDRNYRRVKEGPGVRQFQVSASDALRRSAALIDGIHKELDA